MSIFVNKDTRVLVQGITGREGQFHTRQCVEYGTQIVAGVTPGKGGMEMNGIPVFNTVSSAVEAAAADCSMIFVPPPFAADAIMEAADAGIGLIIAITEGIPVLDMMRVKRFLETGKSRLIGPNCPGIITPGEAKIGIMPGAIHKSGGPIGVISRSGTLTYEVVFQLTREGIGQTTCIGIGGDPVKGLNFVELLKMFEEDPETDAVILIVDVTNLGRQLTLAAPILSLGLPTLVALNMADDLHSRGGSVDTAKLAEQVGAPVVVEIAGGGDRGSDLGVLGAAVVGVEAAPVSAGVDRHPADVLAVEVEGRGADRQVRPAVAAAGQ